MNKLKISAAMGRRVMFLNYASSALSDSGPVATGRFPAAFGFRKVLQHRHSRDSVAMPMLRGMRDDPRPNHHVCRQK